MAQIVFVSALQRLLDAVSLGFANGRVPARLPSVQSGASLAEVGARLSAIHWQFGVECEGLAEVDCRELLCAWPLVALEGLHRARLALTCSESSRVAQGPCNTIRSISFQTKGFVPWRLENPLPSGHALFLLPRDVTRGSNSILPK